MDTNTTSTWKPRSGLNDSLLLDLPNNVANISSNRVCPLQKLAHGKIRRLVGVGERMSRDGKTDKMMSRSLLSFEFSLDGIM